MKLLDKIGTTVFKTDLTRKLTIDGVTKAYPVYRINIKELYYNDQNDRIATWMSEYRSKHPHAPIETLTTESYNDVIQEFIVESNPAAINKTKTNIGLVGQRESGVVLNDGRVIDGNRRFTCIRKLHEEDENQCWFEALILDLDINNDKKRIKMLELEIQHGEEQRVDYNNIDMLVGIYHDIVETKLLTEDEYAKSVDVKVNVIKKEIETAKLLMEFLEFINMPKKYFVAREYAVYAVLGELQTLISHVKDNETKEDLKHIIFINTIFEAIIDQKVFIRSISKMVTNNTINRFIEEEKKIFEEVYERWDLDKPTDVSSLKIFVRKNYDIKDELVECFKNAKTIAATKETHGKASSAVQKGINAMMDIDINLIDKLDPLEKAQLKSTVEKASGMLNVLATKAEGKPLNPKKTKTHLDGPLTIQQEVKKSFTLIPSYLDEMITLDPSTSNSITSLIIKIVVSCEKSGKYYFAFFDKDNNLVSNEIIIDLENNATTLRFELLSKASSEKEIYLGIKKDGDAKNNFRQLIKFDINIAFAADFGF